MDCYTTLILLFCGFSLNCCSQLPPRKYYYVNLKMNWTDAQHYCRVKYTDLATFESMDDISRLTPTLSYSWAWIGLRDEPQSWKGMGNDTNSWRWSATGETSKTGYHNWRVNEPNSAKGQQNCVTMQSTGQWHDDFCQSLKSFVCYNGTNQNEKTYVLIPTAKTWTEARDYCREHHTDLPVIESPVENTEVSSAKSSSDQIWIGLYRVPWTWSDSTQSSFRFWRSNSPNNYGGNQMCMAENTQHEWDDGSCDSMFPFICHQVLKLKTAVRMKIQADADITDPATNTQMDQQLGAALTSRGWTDFNLQWKIQPRAQKKKLSEP